MKRHLLATAALAVAASVVGDAPPSLAVDPSRIENADKNPNDWLTYHGTYKWLALQRPRPDQHRQREGPAGRLDALPGPHDARHAVDAARGRRRALLHRLLQPGVRARRRDRQGAVVLHSRSSTTTWSPRQTHSPYNRGMAMGDGKLYVGTVDGRLIALDMKTGKPAWDTKLINSQKLTVGFTGAPLFVKDKVIIGAQGGEWPCRGPIFGVDARDRQEEVGVLHRRRHATRRRRPGATTPGAPAAAAAGCPAPTTRDQHGVVGHRQSGAAVRLGRRRLEDRRRAAGRQPLHHLGDRARSRHRQAQVLSPGAAARRLGLRQRGRRVRA